MYLIIDNYDSFVYTLASYFRELGASTRMVRNDRIDVRDVEYLMSSDLLEGIVISPGPKSPDECGNCKRIVGSALGRVPILGVCLGHQILAEVLGGRVIRGTRPMHGKVTRIHTDGAGLFTGIPRSFDVTRYHSLIVDGRSLPSVLHVSATTADGAIMALRHQDLPVFGVQFHPEAVFTDFGHEILANFIATCKS